MINVVYKILMVADRLVQMPDVWVNFVDGMILFGVVPNILVHGIVVVLSLDEFEVIDVVVSQCQALAQLLGSLKKKKCDQSIVTIAFALYIMRRVNKII